MHILSLLAAVIMAWSLPVSGCKHPGFRDCVPPVQSSLCHKHPGFRNGCAIPPVKFAFRPVASASARR